MGKCFFKGNFKKNSFMILYQVNIFNNWRHSFLLPSSPLQTNISCEPFSPYAEQFPTQLLKAILFQWWDSNSQPLCSWTNTHAFSQTGPKTRKQMGLIIFCSTSNTTTMEITFWELLILYQIFCSPEASGTKHDY